jgi:tRNA(Arg) A34 adenosine deaminase TadA
MSIIESIDHTNIPTSIRRILEKYVPDPDQQYNHIAITTHKNRVVAIGRNIYAKSHPMQFKFATQAAMGWKQYLHSEIAALVKSRGKIDTMYVFRVDSFGNLKNSAPCPICQLAILESGIDCYHS